MKLSPCMLEGGWRVSIFERSPPTSSGVGVSTRGACSPTAATFGNCPTTGLGVTRAASKPSSPSITATPNQGPERLKETSVT